MTDYPFKTKPYKHQLECWETSKDLTNYALLMEMRTGKTKVVIDTAAWLYDQGKIDGLLIMAPKGNYRDWLDIYEGERVGQVIDHMPEHVRMYATYWTSNQTQYMKQTYRKLFQPSEDLHILVMNTEALSHKTGVEFAAKFLRTHTSLLAIDESTQIKNKSKRTMSAIQLGGLAKYRRILTGRMITRSPLDAFYQCYFLDYKLLGFGSYFAFRNRYAILQKMYLGNRTFDKVVGYQRVDELTAKLKAFSYRIRQDECSDIPEKTYMYRDVDLTPEQEKYYAQMKNMAIVQLSALSVVTAPMVMTRMQKLHEIVCGFIRDSDTGVLTEIPNNRLQAVLDILEETDQKVIIWSTNTYDIEKLYQIIAKEHGPGSVAKYHGDTGDDERQEIKRRFQDPNDELRFFIGNQATGKFGLTLTEAKVMIYYANDYNLENRLQSEERSQFLAQKESLLVIDIRTRGTIDDRYITNLRQKKDISDLVMTLDSG
jgi:SNF2 family DNA or RNA helicase